MPKIPEKRKQVLRSFRLYDSIDLYINGVLTNGTITAITEEYLHVVMGDDPHTRYREVPYDYIEKFLYKEKDK